MLNDPLTLEPAVVAQIIRDLGRIEADQLAILVALDKAPERARDFAKRSAAAAERLAQQLVDLRMAEALAKPAPPAKKPKRPATAKPKEAERPPLDFSGSMLSVLLHTA